MLKRILILLAVAGAYLAQPALAQTKEYRWDSSQWGSNPFSRERPDAIARINEGLRPMSMPEGAKELLKAEVQRNPEGTPHAIRNLDRFVEMQSGGGLEHNVLVVVLDNDRDRARVPSATRWEVTYEGRIYVLVLPDICHNWAWFSEEPRPPEAPPEPECYELHVPTHAGDRATFRIRAGGKTLPPYGCRSYLTASGVEAAWPTCFDCFVADGRLVIYVDRKIAENYEVEICWEHQGAPSRKGVVPPNAWINGKFVVPDLETIAPIPKG